jgi:hypothetical protein
MADCLQRPVVYDALNVYPLLRRKTLPALGATGFYDSLPCSGGHSGTKTVSTSALEAAWLKSTLHFSNP